MLNVFLSIYFICLFIEHLLFAIFLLWRLDHHSDTSLGQFPFSSYDWPRNSMSAVWLVGTVVSYLEGDILTLVLFVNRD